MADVSGMSRAARVERMSDVKGALRRGVNVEQRACEREQKADRWVEWFRHRLEARGGDVAQYLPDMCAELETRVQDEVSAAIKRLKDELKAALK
jgi:hypothetical protein